MKIFITGIAGFLGSHLAERLIAEGHNVSGCDNLVGGYLDNVPEGAIFHKVDCLDNNAMVKLTKNIDVVYHLAAASHEGLSIFSPYYYTTNTYTSSMSVISATLANNVTRFILCSSAARYGELTPPFTEDMLPKPQDPYGIAKYATDLALIELGNTHGMEFVIAVPHNIIGTRQKYDDPYRNVASIFINLMLQGRAPTIYGDGSQERSFSFVSDIVDPMVTMAFAPEANGEVINIGPDKQTTTILELAQTIAELTDFKGEFNFVTGRPREVKIVHLSADKARKLLGYEPKKDLREGLAEMVAWIKKRGPKPFEYKLPIELPDSPLLPITWKEKRF
jgi:UDP-glucose 4-epimerase